MKVRFIALFIFVFSSIFAQKSISGKSYIVNKNDYSFLDNILKNKKIVLLGEQSHGDGATFDEKINLIKYLHEKLGYNTIVFENGLYDNYKAFQEYSKHNQKSLIFNESIFELWSDTKSFQDLLSYIDERASKNDTIKIAGFDNQEGSLFDDNYLNDLKNTLRNHQIKIPENTIQKLEKAFVSRDLDNIATSKTDSINLSENYDFILKSFQKISNLSYHEKMLQQVFISKIADVNFDVQQLQKQKIKVQNPRDLQMARNLIFLSELNPNEKMICWGASYHFANDIKYDYTDVTESYMNLQAELEKKAIGQTDYKLGDGKTMLDGAKPMGIFLKDYFKNEMYTIAFSSFEGSYGVVDSKQYLIPKPPASSVEQQLFDTKKEKVFLDFDKSDNTNFYCSALGNIPIKANWNQMFDGLLFVKTAYQPETRTYEKSNILENSSNSFVITGKILNSKNNTTIVNADVSITNSNKSIIGNKNGGFGFTIPKTNFNDKLIISALGYYSDTISIAKLVSANKVLLKIRLKPQIFDGYLLNEVVISSKQKTLSADEIVEKARKNVEFNYCQNPYNQKFYFKTQIMFDDKIKKNEEAIVNTFNAKGLNSSNDPSQNFYGEIEQIRNTTNNLSQEQYAQGSNGLWLVLDKNLILSKENVLFRTSSYDLKKEGVVIYNNKRVYKISFINNSPGSYSTGFGYPAPKSSSGILYIDSESFAVLRYEHCVEREVFSPKSKPNNPIQQFHKIIETYKLVNGKYFLNYSSKTDKMVKLNDPDINSWKEYYLVYNLMSLDIEINNIQKINRPIEKLTQNVELLDNKEFWNNNLFNLEDGKYKFDNCN
ncbi:erythromycin esterase family protein [Flavobacterium psychrophilum]|uniref:erythromycin esterase family protein n=1 Tax=Flavobacterium psychrophilum TaxID=96345 RepID=UPI003138A32A